MAGRRKGRREETEMRPLLNNDDETFRDEAESSTGSKKQMRFMVLGGDDDLMDKACATILGERENRDAFKFGILEPRKAQVCGQQVSVLKTPSYWLKHLKSYFLFSKGVKSPALKNDLQYFQSEMFPGPHAFLLVHRDVKSSGKDNYLLHALSEVFGKEVLDYCMVLFMDRARHNDPTKNSCLKMCGSRHHVLKNTDDSVKQLFRQTEVMTWGKNSFFTNHLKSFRKAKNYFKKEYENELKREMNDSKKRENQLKHDNEKLRRQQKKLQGSVARSSEHHQTTVTAAETFRDEVEWSTGSNEQLRLLVLGGDDALMNKACATILGERENRHKFTFGELKPREAQVCGRQVSVLKTSSYWLKDLKSNVLFSNGVKSLKNDLQVFESALFPGPHAFLLVHRDMKSSGKDHYLLSALSEVFGKEVLDFCMVLFMDRARHNDPTKNSCLKMCGSRHHVLKNTDDSVKQLFRKTEAMTQWKNSSFFTNHLECFRKAEHYFKNEYEKELRREMNDSRKRENQLKLDNEKLRRQQKKLQGSVARSSEHHQTTVTADEVEWSTGSSEQLRLLVLGGDDALMDEACATILGERENRHKLTFGELEPREAQVCGRQVSVLKTSSDWLKDLKSNLLFCKGVKSLKNDLHLCESEMFPGPHAFLLVHRDVKSSGKDHYLLSALSEVFGKEVLDYCMVLFMDGARHNDPTKNSCLKMCRGRHHILKNTDDSVKQLFRKTEAMGVWKNSRFFTNHLESFRKAEKYFKAEFEEKNKLRRELNDSCEHHQTTAATAGADPKSTDDSDEDLRSRNL